MTRTVVEKLGRRRVPERFGRPVEGGGHLQVSPEIMPIASRQLPHRPCRRWTATDYVAVVQHAMTGTRRRRGCLNIDTALGEVGHVRTGVGDGIADTR